MFSVIVALDSVVVGKRRKRCGEWAGFKNKVSVRKANVLLIMFWSDFLP